MVIVITFEHKPISWKRPAQSNECRSRYDEQKLEKAAIAIEAYSQVKTNINKKPLFIAPIVTIEATFKEARFFSKQDVDNIAKFYLDAMQSHCMQGVLWNDDANVVQLISSKKLGDKNKVVITIKESQLLPAVSNSKAKPLLKTLDKMGLLEEK